MRRRVLAIAFAAATGLAAADTPRARSEEPRPYEVVAELSVDPTSSNSSLGMSSRWIILASTGGAQFIQREASDNSADWTRLDLVPPPGGTASFGRVVTIDGSGYVVGDPGARAAWVYDFGMYQVNKRKLVPSDTLVSEGFASTVAMCSHSVAVGAPASNAVHVFGDRPGVIRAPNADAEFGRALSCDGSTLMISATGVVYAYQVDNKLQWALVRTLRAPDAAAGDGFGAAVSTIPGPTSAVGAPFHGAGAVYVFTDGGETVKLDAPPGVSEFGSSIDFAAGPGEPAESLVVGAPGGSSAVFTYALSAGKWSLDSSTAAPPASKRFGREVATSGKFDALVGAEGKAFVMRRSVSITLSTGGEPAFGSCRSK